MRKENDRRFITLVIRACPLVLLCIFCLKVQYPLEIIYRKLTVRTNNYMVIGSEDNSKAVYRIGPAQLFDTYWVFTQGGEPHALKAEDLSSLFNAATYIEVIRLGDPGYKEIQEKFQEPPDKPSTLPGSS